MASWDFWDWVAYLCILVAALLLAAAAGLKGSPTLVPHHLPDWIRSEYWSFAPLLLLILSGAIFCVKAIFVRFDNIVGSTARPTSPPPETIRHREEYHGVFMRSAVLMFAPEDVYYLHDTAPERGYPHKLWIVVRNESRGDLVVSPAAWETSVEDISVRPTPKQHPWTPEGSGGWKSNSWNWPPPDRELAPIHVARGQVIQTYVGLSEPLDGPELRRLIVSKRLGTLIIPFTVNGYSRTESIKL